MFVRFIYNILTSISWIVLGIVALFNPKIKLFVSGRRETFSLLRSKISSDAKYIWMHVASLGEYEQGLPILEKLRTDYPSYKIVLTFFSPSGYEVKKNSPFADIVAYMPLDSISNARKFINLISPEMAIFIKYEIWPNYLRELKHRNIPTFLVSAIFSERQIFFKGYGGFMRKSLQTFSHFFVQNSTSEALLKSIGFNNVTISGDTRFDRVSKILGQNNQLDFMDNFKGNDFCFVAGSSWPEDETIFIDHINTSTLTVKYVIAPHNIKKGHIESLRKQISKNTICHSEINGQAPSDAEVLIIDTIGILTKIYSYANAAYVGGGFATGLHNTLEPAVFGIPVIIGPKYQGFKEAEELVDQNGIQVVNDSTEFQNLMIRLVNEPDFKESLGNINSTYVKSNQGATSLILQHIKTFLYISST